MTNTSFLNTLQLELDGFKAKGLYRELPLLKRQGTMIRNHCQPMINFSSNDYLGIAEDAQLRQAFLKTIHRNTAYFSASSSRSMTGNFPQFNLIEGRLSNLFGSESALVFNSGYHMNTGILPAVTNAATLILADKLVHASLIDGIRLSKGKFIRYPHADYDRLEQFVEANSAFFSQIIIVTESIFSMDGDVTDLRRLVKIKQNFSNVLLYIDEAHAFGVRGRQGLGCAEEQDCIAEIDFLVGTFGKAIGSVGGYIACSRLLRDYLVNKMRTLIYSTALPPINLLWSLFVLDRLPSLQNRRKRLQENSALLSSQLKDKGYHSDSGSHILPIMIGDSKSATQKAEMLQKSGFYLLPVRPPTVPAGSSRLRISLTSAITAIQINSLIEHL